MKKLINTLSKAIQLVLAAPVKLPAKVMQVVKYIALGLGILETVVPDQEEHVEKPSEEGENERMVQKEVEDE